MYEYDDEVLDTFLKKQTQLFSEEVADTPEAAEEFLEDCMAVVCKNIKEVRDYFDEAGSDISGMSDDLAMAMEARCYNGGEGRTKMKPLVYEKDDKIAYLFIFAFLAVVIVLRILLPVNLGNLIFR